jgi:hypothetical protein
VDTEDDYTGEVTDGLWRNETRGLSSVSSLGSNNHSKAAGQLRDEYANYFFEKDPLPWQKKINRCRIIGHVSKQQEKQVNSCEVRTMVSRYYNWLQFTLF